MQRILVLGCLALVLGSGVALAAAPLFNVDREFYPYYPSLLKWNKSNATFTDPEVCSGCHEKQYAEWRTSVHSYAFRDPIYQGELNKAVKAVGHEISRQCEGCHTPIGVVTGEVKATGLSGLSPIALAGVSCDVCHSVSGVTHTQTPAKEPENGSLILSPGVDTKDGTVLIKRGPWPVADDCGGGFHQCEESPLHLNAELCASCHQVYHYDAHFPLEATYLEWKHGPYAQNNILCQDCHMVETEVFKRSADTLSKPQRGEYQHVFNGANYLLSYLAALEAKKAGDPALAESFMQQYQGGVARLQAAAALELTPVYRAGQLAELRVRVKNLRAGHNLPTSLTNVRQMWLEVTVKDNKGRVVMTTGTVQADGALPEGARVFNSDGMGNDFHFAVDPWVVTAFSRHETIPPRGYKDVFYGLPPVKGAKGLTVTATLRYRQAGQDVAEALLAAVPKDIDLAGRYGLTAVPPLPVVDMATTTLVVPSRP